MTMLTKIRKLSNMPVFEGLCWSHPDLSFQKTNLLYGFNGSGKTLLSNVIRSFSDDEDAATIPPNLQASGEVPIEIDLEWSGTTVRSFNNPKKVIVFNSNFVSEHLYDGSASRVRGFKSGVVTNDELKNPQIKQLEQQLTDLKRDQQGVAEQLSRLYKASEAIYKQVSKIWNQAIPEMRLTGLGLGLKEGSRVPEQAPEVSSEQLERRLRDHFQRYQISRNQATLQSDLHAVQQLEFPDLPLPFGLVELLQRDIVRRALSVVDKRLRSLTHVQLKHGSVQQWFQDGNQLLEASLESRICPLCGSLLPRLDELVADYNDFFSQEFAALQQSLQDSLQVLAAIEPRADKLAVAVEQLKGYAMKYGLRSGNDHPNIDQLASLDAALLLDRTRAVLSFASEKAANLHKLPSQSELEIAQEFLGELQSLNSKLNTLRDLQNRVATYLETNTFSAPAAKNTVRDWYWALLNEEGAETAIQGELLSSVEAQPAQTGLQLLRNLRARSAELSAMEQEITQKRNQLLARLKDESKYVNRFLPLLMVSHLKIRIDQQPAKDIQILYESGCVKMGMRYTLSDGEKTALAFAYFLSKIQFEIVDNVNDRLGDYVVVIDDPISSLDENRIFATATIIQRMFAQQARQLFVFSHNLLFLKVFGNVLTKDDNQDRADWFLGDGVISPLPPAFRNYHTSYFYKLSMIQKYVDGTIPYDQAKEFVPNFVRTVLEAFLSFKFCRLRQGSGNSQKYQSAGLDRFISLIEGIDLAGYSATPTIHDRDELRAILLRIKFHVDRERHGSPQDITEFEYIPESELQQCAKDALEVIAYLDKVHLDQVVSQIVVPETQRTLAPATTPVDQAPPP